MPVVSEKDVPANTFRQVRITASDFVAAPQESSNISAGENTEVLRAEIGEDGQLSSYSVLQLGQPAPGPGDYSNNLFVNLVDTSGNELPDDTQIRFVSRPKNDDSRTELTGYITLRDLDNSRPDLRQALDPVTDDMGRPNLSSFGRILAVEVKNESQSVEVSQSKSTLEVPAIAGY